MNISLKYDSGWARFAPREDGKYELLESVMIRTKFIKSQKGKDWFVIRRGFITDFRTGPGYIDNFLIKTSMAFVVHDYLYRAQICSRKEADIEQDHWLKDDPNFTWFDRKMIYIAVRLFGGYYWDLYKK